MVVVRLPRCRRRRVELDEVWPWSTLLLSSLLSRGEAEDAELDHLALGPRVGGEIRDEGFDGEAGEEFEVVTGGAADAV